MPHIPLLQAGLGQLVGWIYLCDILDSFWVEADLGVIKNIQPECFQ